MSYFEAFKCDRCNRITEKKNREQGIALVVEDDPPTQQNERMIHLCKLCTDEFTKFMHRQTTISHRQVEKIVENM